MLLIRCPYCEQDLPELRRSKRVTGASAGG